jgi:hypothetical protein
MENKLTRQADEQMRSKEESCNTKTAKWRTYYISFNNNFEC